MSSLPKALTIAADLEWLLRIAVALVLLSRAVQHLYWDAPFAALLWNQELLESSVKLWLGWDWQRWATSRAVADGMQTLTLLHGVVYLLTAVAVLLPLSSRHLRDGLGVALYVASVLLVGLAGLYCLDAKRQVGQLLEHSLQCALPLVLALVLRNRGRFSGLHQCIVRLAIAGTFAGHGLYALGYYEVPGQFVTLVMQSLHVSEPTAHDLLKVAGVLDFAVAVGVLAAIRLPALDLPVLIYAAIWGALTALSRVIAFFRWDLAIERVSEWLHETLLRLPHGVAPLFLLLVLVMNARSRSLGRVEDFG